MSALLEQHLAHIRLRIIEDALAQGTAAYWTRRADQFAAVGNPACDQIAQACRHHASLLRDIGLDPEATTELHEVLLRRALMVGGVE